MIGYKGEQGLLFRGFLRPKSSCPFLFQPGNLRAQFSSARVEPLQLAFGFGQQPVEFAQVPHGASHKLTSSQADLTVSPLRAQVARLEVKSGRARSDPTTVVVQLSSAQADIPFLQMVIAEEERTGIRMPLDSLIVLARLRKERRLDVQTMAAAIQKNSQLPARCWNDWSKLA